MLFQPEEPLQKSQNLGKIWCNIFELVWFYSSRRSGAFSMITFTANVSQDSFEIHKVAIYCTAILLYFYFFLQVPLQDSRQTSREMERSGLFIPKHMIRIG